MTTTTKSQTRKLSFKEQNEQIENIVERMQTAMLTTKSSDKFKSYLNFLSRQYQYSANNCLLIWSQGGTLVKNGHAWKREDRRILDWNKKIYILAPIIAKIEIKDEHGHVVKNSDGKIEKREQCVGFREMYVFDISNTEGKPLPVNPLTATWEIDESTLGQKMWYQFLNAMDNKGITIEYLSNGNTSLKGSTNGKVIRINENLSDHDKFLVGIHEYAHYVNHFTKERNTLTKEVKELQAESIAYVIAEKYGMKNNGIEYCALYHREHDLKDSIKIISNTVKDIIKMLD